MTSKELKDNISVYGVLDILGISYEEGRKINCPLPGHEDNTPSFSVNPHTNNRTYKCFACDSSGDIFSLYQAVKGVDFITAYHELCDYLGVVPEGSKPNNDYKEKMHFTEADTYATEVMSYTLSATVPQAMKYLRERGLTDEVIKDFKLGVYPKIDKALIDKVKPNPNNLYDDNGNTLFSARIVFPLLDKSGKYTLGYAGRAVDYVDGNIVSSDRQPKYINTANSSNPLGYHKNTYLYGFHKCKGYNSVYVVEGYMDVLAMNVIGITNCVAIGGTSLTSSHLEQLSSKQIILLFDNDIAGFNAALRTQLKYPHVHFMYGTLPKKIKDPNDLIPYKTKPLSKLINISRLPQYFYLNVPRHVDMGDLQKREKVFEYLQEFSDKLSVECDYTEYLKTEFKFVVKKLMEGV